MGSVLIFKKPNPNPCKLCGKQLTDEYSELAYEVINEDGTGESIAFGKICKECADTLDDFDERDDMAPEDDDDI